MVTGLSVPAFGRHGQPQRTVSFCHAEFDQVNYMAWIQLGVTQRDAGKEIFDVVAGQHVIFWHLDFSDLSDEFLRIDGA
ncbi:hypothetical protein M513_07815 [Trichuris suis]|uniref:Uncharacterized protein n=1 Tax=Trichuris suis TaxID=68888 RepID=A0A085M2G4_9BILA|nr:hypothetical protein M513_07815 [Trichuris suis]